MRTDELTVAVVKRKRKKYNIVIKDELSSKILVNPYGAYLQEKCDATVNNAQDKCRARLLHSQDYSAGVAQVMRNRSGTYTRHGGTVGAAYDYPATTTVIKITWWTDINEDKHVRIDAARVDARKAAPRIERKLAAYSEDILGPAALIYDQLDISKIRDIIYNRNTDYFSNIIKHVYIDLRTDYKNYELKELAERKIPSKQKDKLRRKINNNVTTPAAITAITIAIITAGVEERAPSVAELLTKLYGANFSQESPNRLAQLLVPPPG